KSPRMERREARRPDRKGRRGASQAPPACLASRPPVPRKHRAPVGAPPPLRGGNVARPGRNCVAGTIGIARRTGLAQSKTTSPEHFVFESKFLIDFLLRII